MEKFTTLKEFLTNSGLTDKEFADLIPCARSTITLIKNGNIKPGWKMARRIEECSHKIVSHKQWFPDKVEI